MVTTTLTDAEVLAELTEDERDRHVKWFRSTTTTSVQSITVDGRTIATERRARKEAEAETKKVQAEIAGADWRVEKADEAATKFKAERDAAVWETKATREYVADLQAMIDAERAAREKAEAAYAEAREWAEKEDEAQEHLKGEVAALRLLNEKAEAALARVTAQCAAMREAIEPIHLYEHGHIGEYGECRRSGWVSLAAARRFEEAKHATDAGRDLVALVEEMAALLRRLRGVPMSGAAYGEGKEVDDALAKYEAWKGARG